MSHQLIQPERGDFRSDQHRTPEAHDEIQQRAGCRRPRIVLGPQQRLRPEFNSKTVVRPCHNPTSRAVFNVRRCSTALQWIGAAEGFHGGIPSHLFPHPLRWIGRTTCGAAGSSGHSAVPATRTSPSTARLFGSRHTACFGRSGSTRAWRVRYRTCCASCDSSSYSSRRGGSVFRPRCGASSQCRDRSPWRLSQVPRPRAVLFGKALRCRECGATLMVWSRCGRRGEWEVHCPNAARPREVFGFDPRTSFMRKLSSTIYPWRLPLAPICAEMTRSVTTIL